MSTEMLVPCLGCNKAIDPSAAACPHCGKQDAGATASTAVEHLADQLIYEYETGYEAFRNLLNLPRPNGERNPFGLPFLHRCVSCRDWTTCPNVVYCSGCGQRYSIDSNGLYGPAKLDQSELGYAFLESRLAALQSNCNRRDDHCVPLSTIEQIFESHSGQGIDSWQRQFGTPETVRTFRDGVATLRYVDLAKDELLEITADVIVQIEKDTCHSIHFVRDRIHDILVSNTEPADFHRRLSDVTELPSTRQFKEMVLGRSPKQLLALLGKPHWIRQDSQGFQVWRYLSVARPKLGRACHAFLSVQESCVKAEFCQRPPDLFYMREYLKEGLDDWTEGD